MAQRDSFKIIFGGWYQRTTLHLSEVYGFLLNGYSKLDLSSHKLHAMQEALNLKEVTREVGNLEYVKATTLDGIEIRYYEDGLYVLELNAFDIKGGQKILEDYFNNIFNPAIAYIFSLGAPTPKVLANIESTHPVVVSVLSDNPSDFKVEQSEFGDVYSTITSENITVYKTPDYIFVTAQKKYQNIISQLMEMQIFFREFKDQLEKYLNIHRTIWEEISKIKEQQTIKGKDVEKTRIRLDSYQKTMNLISSRINQMSVYVHTRASIAQEMEIEKQLNVLFRYKFEVLSNTHSYIREIWSMTGNYVSAAIEIIKDIEGRSINRNIRSIQILASIGVISGILGYLTADKFPSITQTGIIYFSILLILILPINFIINWIYRNLKYEINFPERAKHI